MENVQQEKQHPTRSLTLAEKIRSMEKKVELQDRTIKTTKEEKKFKFPFKWRWKFNQTSKKANDDKILVIFLNKKGEIENPRFMPIFDGNMIVWKNKPYEFDPRATWLVKGMKKNPKAYLIKEIDRRPVRNKYDKLVYADASVSNLDLDEVRVRGDSTESDEFLIKAALKAQTWRSQGTVNKAALVVIAIIIIGGIIWFMSSSGS